MDRCGMSKYQEQTHISYKDCQGHAKVRGYERSDFLALSKPIVWIHMMGKWDILKTINETTYPVMLEFVFNYGSRKEVPKRGQISS